MVIGESFRFSLFQLGLTNLFLVLLFIVSMALGSKDPRAYLNL